MIFVVLIVNWAAKKTIDAGHTPSADCKCEL